MCQSGEKAIQDRAGLLMAVKLQRLPGQYVTFDVKIEIILILQIQRKLSLVTPLQRLGDFISQ